MNDLLRIVQSCACKISSVFQCRICVSISSLCKPRDSQDATRVHIKDFNKEIMNKYSFLFAFDQTSFTEFTFGECRVISVGRRKCQPSHSHVNVIRHRLVCRLNISDVMSLSCPQRYLTFLQEKLHFQSQSRCSQIDIKARRQELRFFYVCVCARGFHRKAGRCPLCT